MKVLMNYITKLSKRNKKNSILMIKDQTMRAVRLKIITEK